MKTVEFKEKYNGNTNTEDFKIALATAILNYFDENLPEYDQHTINIRKISNHPDDWYLFRVMAKRKEEKSTGWYLRQKDGKCHDFACWTCWNMSTETLNFGHYDLTEERAEYILNHGV